MRLLTVKDAVNEALAQEMERDSRVFLMGEDIAGGAGRDHIHPPALDAWGGPFGVTKGLVQRFGRSRVRDTAIAETGFIGAAVGAAFAGLRPVAELMYVDFMGVCFDQLLNQAAKLRYVYGGKTSIPMVLRTVVGAGFRAAAEHSQTLYSLFTHVPGLKAVAPTTPYDAKGLLIAAIRDPDPVVVFEHKRLYMLQGEVPEEPYTIPLGRAVVRREGTDVTIVGIQKMSLVALEAAERLAPDGISAEVIDPRSLSPLDEDTILTSVRKTGRLVVVDESNPRCGLAADIAALAAERAFEALCAPIKKVTAPHAPVPFSPPLEDAYVPDAARVIAAVRAILP
jgi:pyruvate/2-oxoglutarate/acetoin dehydrogenase E1 component